MNKPKVYLNDLIIPKVYNRLKEKAEIVDNYHHPELLDTIIVRQANCPRDVIEKTKNLKIISMHGTGALAKEVFRIMKDGFNTKVLAYNSHRITEEILEMGYEQVESLEELFAKSDIIFVCVTLNDKTRNMLNYDVFKHSKEGLIL